MPECPDEHPGGHSSRRLVLAVLYKAHWLPTRLCFPRNISCYGNSLWRTAPPDPIPRNLESNSHHIHFVKKSQVQKSHAPLFMSLFTDSFESTQFISLSFSNITAKNVLRLRSILLHETRHLKVIFFSSFIKNPQIAIIHHIKVDYYNWLNSILIILIYY